MQHYRKFSLKKHNSFRLDSIANDIWFPENIKELITLFQDLKDTKFHILGSGTNILFNKQIDKIISLKKMARFFIPLNKKMILVSASYPTNIFINEIIKMNFTGVERLIGIPGLLGGAIVMNAGSGQSTISDFLVGCNVLTKKGDIVFKLKKDLKFKRRYSILQDTKEAIISAIFEFDKEGTDTELIQNTKEYRKSLPKKPSAGGIFVNWHKLKPYSNKLIGLNDGDAIVSEKVNIIINQNNATFKNITNLINKIKTIVNKDLQLEIKILGV